MTITPNPDVNGFVTVSLYNFEDQVLPTPNVFDALTPAELVADTPQLSDNVEAERSRRAVNGREVLEVRVQTAAATDIYKTAADHRAANPRLQDTTWERRSSSPQTWLSRACKRSRS